MTPETKPNSGRKLFFGLFVFPLLIAVGMALLLCTVVFLTNEHETPDTLIASIKKSPSGKRWQKAFELSNELNRGKDGIRSEAVMGEAIHILDDAATYDEKTRAYIAIALSHFRNPQSVAALRRHLKDPSTDVVLYSLWSLGSIGAREAAPDAISLLASDDPALREMAVYVLGIVGDAKAIPHIRPFLSHATADLRWNAALSLARLGDDSGLSVLGQMMDRRTLAAEANMSESQTEKVMVNAAKGLALIQKPESIKILESVSKSDPNLKVRQAAIDALAYIYKERKTAS